MAHALACTSCGSESTRTVPMVHASGISNTTSRTTGVGLSGGGLGVGTATTTGVSQTVLSEKLSPPRKRAWFKHMFGAFMLGVVLSPIVGGTAGLFVFLGGIALAAYLGLTGFRFNRNEWPGLHAYWQASFLCDRCGTVFLPAAA